MGRLKACPDCMYVMVLQKMMLFYNDKNISTEVSLKGSKRISDFDKVYGVRFDHFYMARLRECRVKIYDNGEMVRTELARGPLKHCRNWKSFSILSN